MIMHVLLFQILEINHLLHVKGGQNVGIYFIFKNEGNQDLTAMSSLHLEQLSPKHNVALLSDKKFFTEANFFKEKKHKFQKDQL